MILFGHIDMVMFILADVMPFNVVNFLDRCYNQGMCGRCYTTHWQMLLPCEMVLPHLLDMCGYILYMADVIAILY